MKNKKIMLSLYLNIFFIVLLIFLFSKGKQTEFNLNTAVIPERSYIAKRSDNEWDTDSPRGYYLFTNKDKSFKITTFEQKLIFKSKYKFVGNGVYELSDNQGFIISNKDEIEVHLNRENHLIFESYVLFNR